MTAWELPPDLHSAASARQHLRSALAGTSAVAVTDEAELLVSEVVTNAVVHGRPTVTLEVQVAGPRLRVAVTDCSPCLPVVRDLDLMGTGGRGMALVAALAERWGVGPGTAAASAAGMPAGTDGGTPGGGTAAVSRSAAGGRGGAAGKTVWFEMTAPGR